MYFKKTLKNAITPSRGSGQAAGIDLFLPYKADPAGMFGQAKNTYRIGAGETIIVDTGIAMDFPKNVYGLIRPRGSAQIRGLVINGTVDSDYRGSIQLVITNAKNMSIDLFAGKAYAQIILMKMADRIMLADDYFPSALYEMTESTSISNTTRGEGRFGSTGNS